MGRLVGAAGDSDDCNVDAETLAKRTAAREEQRLALVAPIDVFVTPRGGSIKLWDVCAPHAFLRCIGGDMVTLEGASLRYDCLTAEGAAATEAVRSTLPFGGVEVKLRDGVLACRSAEILAEVLRRIRLLN